MTTVGQEVDFNPANAAPANQQNDGFAARVLVRESRFVKLTYGSDLSTNYDPMIALQWKVTYPTGREMDGKMFSTGLKWGNDLCTVSPDGKKLVAKSADFKGIGSNSDAMHFLRCAIAAGFPSEQITNDMSVFEGHAFLIADSKNPNSKGSGVKPYPKTYYPQGWAALMTEYKAKQGQNGPQSDYKPAQASQAAALSDDVLKAAGEALQAVVEVNGSIARLQIPAALNNVEKVIKMDKGFRQKVTVALWDINQLTTVATSVGLSVEGDVVHK